MRTVTDQQAKILLDLINDAVTFPPNHQKYSDNMCLCKPCVSARAVLMWADALLGPIEGKEGKNE
jgi:hypothetical protein